MGIKSDALLKQRSRIVDYCVDPTKLLETLDGTGDQNSPSAHDAVTLKDVFP